MAHLVWCFFLTLALMGWPPTQANQTELSDPEVARGVRHVEEGDYDAAILTLDRAARRLATDPSQIATLSQAYLYLGIAYLGKGHEAAAKAQFREAISHIKDLTLNPEDFPPKVIDLFEAAKEEAGTTVAEAPAETPPAGSQAPGEEGGSSKLPWILAGAGGAVGVGIIAASSKGEGDSGGGGSIEPYEPMEPIGPQTGTQVFMGVLNEDNWCMEHHTEPGGAGGWRAEVTWAAESRVWIGVFTEAMEEVAEGSNISPNMAAAEWEGCCSFKFEICWLGDEHPNPPGHYELKVTFPRP